MTLSYGRTCAIRFLFALTLMQGNATFIWADAPDPTTPSPQIVKRLALDRENADLTNQGSHGVARKELSRPQLHLKAMVLRDRNSGTALIASDGSKVYVVKLRRVPLNSTMERLNIAGSEFIVKDFSKSSIIMFCLDTNQHFIVN